MFTKQGPIEYEFGYGLHYIPQGWLLLTINCIMHEEWE